MMTGVSILRLRISRRQVIPSTNGIMMSNITRSAPEAASAASAAEPSVASSHWKPSCSKCSRISSRMRGSSSTIKIFAITNTSFSAADGFFVFLIVAYYSADMSNL